MRKKLIEVALPLAKINEAAVRENYIYKGNPSAIHKWWAQRPLAACRAVLFASLVDDPDSDPAYRRPDGSVDEDRAGIKRAELFNLIEELVQWENSNNPRVINQARSEIARCVASRKIETGELEKDEILGGGIRQNSGIPVSVPHSGECGYGGVTPWDFVTRRASPEAVNAFLAEHGPPVLDPFCGGGSIPLEAQRLGLRAYASDLNPVPVLITKALIEIPPNFAGQPPVNPGWQKKKPDEKAMEVWSGAHGLAEDVRYYGHWMREETERRIGHLYPKMKITKELAKNRPDLKDDIGEELTVVAWLWARTVASPNPAAHGSHVPLVRSFWLSIRKGKEAWVHPVLDRKNNSYRFEVGTGKPPVGFDPKKGTVVRTGARCLLTNSPIPLDYIRSEGKGGRIGACLMAIVAEGTRGRIYLSPLKEHSQVAKSAQPKDYPDTDMPQQALGFRVQLYGLDKHYKLFTSRQLVALTTFSDLVQEARDRVCRDASKAGLACNERTTADGEVRAYSSAVTTYLAFALDKTIEYNCSLVPWYTKEDRPKGLFARQAIPMVWDFAEVNPLGDIGGTMEASVRIVSEALEGCPRSGSGGIATQFDATKIASDCPVMLSTDPPYYDNIGYADLSDFFYIWLRRSLASIYPSLFATLLTPKVQELIAFPYRHDGSRQKAQAFFEQGLETVFSRMRKIQHGDYPLTVYYAFKQSESDEDSDDAVDTGAGAVSSGWETMLEGLVKNGFEIMGTWPIRTERGSRMRDFGSNALASSILLVCRPRPANASLATRKQLITALRQELPVALRNLQHGNIAPVDLAQAAIGPGMAIFTRYAKVMETDGSAMTVRTALGLINQALDEVLAEQEGEFDGDTRWALAWFEQFGMDEGPFGVAETLSKAKNTAVNGLVEAGVVTARGGKVRLVKRAELPADWDSTRDGRLTVWEATQHLIRALDQQGESGAAALLHKMGGVAEIARDLAYRLYTLCERKKWAEEALAYNGLVIAWPELTKLALAERMKSSATQPELF